jgi:hypothetical protein
MPPALKEFFRYWSLTLAVLFFYLFAAVVAGMDLWESLMETVRKRRTQLAARRTALDPNPLKGVTVAQTLGLGPGQQPDARRGWVLERARAAADRLGLRVRIVVLEDSLGHALVHFARGDELRTYRVDKRWIEDARGGDAGREAQIVELLERYLASDFLGQHHRRPPRTTELAREAAGKAAPARPAPAGQPASEP